MLRRTPAAVAAFALGALTIGMVPTGAAQAVPPADPANPQTAPRVDDFPHPLGTERRALTRAAAEKLATGEIKVTKNRKGKNVVKLGPGKYVNYDVERHEKIFTILSEFGDKTMQPQGGTPGPLHNQIPEPDRVMDGQPTDDNSTLWRADFNRAYYMDLMFGSGESFRDFYLKQSNGRFSAEGDVSDWVKVPYNEARYGHNPVDGDGTSEAEGYWAYIKDTVTAWYEAQKAAGKSDAEIAAYVKNFDHVDRYDYDADGDFNEPDGYIDHFQAIHAGEGEDAGGGAQGEDAIWSHRWYAYGNLTGEAGPSNNLAGGVQIGNTGIWVGDYTTEPENGGLGVFVHEFGHDLGLPDLYDTSGGDNGVGFWSLMASGSWLNQGKEAIGDRAGYMGPWEKLQLGWLDFTRIPYGQNTRTKLGPADLDGKQTPQALLVNLPDKKVTTDYNTPHSGSYEWWTGSGDNLDNTLTRTVDLTGKSTATLSAWVENRIEADYDYLYVEVSTDGGATWTKVDPAVSGTSGWTQRQWDLTPFVGKAVDVRFRYSSDGGVAEDGGFIDDITITADGTTIFSDDVESGENGWVTKGFTRISGSVTAEYPHYYLAENRVYSGYDRYLKTGPYNFGFPQQPKRVEHFPYQNGMLVWYVNTSVANNNTRQHPGEGEALPVDARPTPLKWSNGTLLRNRIQPFDATFGREATDPITLHRGDLIMHQPSQPGIPTFDDSDPNRYWSAENPWNSVKVAGTGTSITVKSTSKQGMEMQVDVAFRK